MKNDRRFIKTDRHIRAAFISLLNQKGFNKMTVGDIAKEADINRATFYQHYVDKYDLLNACEQQLFHDAEDLMQPMLHVDILALYRNGGVFPGLNSLLKYYKQNQELLLGLLESGVKPSLREKMEVSARTHLVYILDRQFGGKAPYPMHYIATYLISAHISILLEWLNSGARESAEEIAALITRLTLHGTIDGLNLK